MAAVQNFRLGVCCSHTPVCGSEAATQADRFGHEMRDSCRKSTLLRFPGRALKRAGGAVFLRPAFTKAVPSRHPNLPRPPRSSRPWRHGDRGVARDIDTVSGKFSGRLRVHATKLCLARRTIADKTTYAKAYDPCANEIFHSYTNRSRVHVIVPNGTLSAIRYTALSPDKKSIEHHAAALPAGRLEHKRNQAPVLTEPSLTETS